MRMTVQLTKHKEQYLLEYFAAWKKWCPDIPDKLLRDSLNRTWDELVAPYATEANINTHTFRHPEDPS